MPHLIVEPIPEIRQTIRHFFASRNQVVFAAKNLEEAARFIAESRPPKTVFYSLQGVRDPEADFFFRAVENAPHMHRTPIVAILPGTEIWPPWRTYAERYPRADTFIAKPLCTRTLDRMAVEAARARAHRQRQLLVWGNPDGPISRCLRETIAGEKRGFWAGTRNIFSIDELERLTIQDWREIGAFLIIPENLDLKVQHWITKFKRSTQGAEIPSFFLSQSPAVVGRMHSLFQAYLDCSEQEPGALRQQVQAILVLAKQQSLHRYEVETIFQDMKRALQIVPRHAQRTLARRFALDLVHWMPEHPNALLSAAEALRDQGDQEGAIRTCLRALEFNPFLPKGYLLLLPLLGEIHPNLLPTWREKASAFCADHAGVRELIRRSAVTP